MRWRWAVRALVFAGGCAALAAVLPPAPAWSYGPVERAGQRWTPTALSDDGEHCDYECAAEQNAGVWRRDRFGAFAAQPVPNSELDTPPQSLEMPSGTVVRFDTTTRREADGMFLGVNTEDKPPVLEVWESAEDPKSRRKLHSFPLPAALPDAGRMRYEFSADGERLAVEQKQRGEPPFEKRNAHIHRPTAALRLVDTRSGNAVPALDPNTAAARQFHHLDHRHGWTCVVLRHAKDEESALLVGPEGSVESGPRGWGMQADSGWLMWNDGTRKDAGVLRARRYDLAETHSVGLPDGQHLFGLLLSKDPDYPTLMLEGLVTSGIPDAAGAAFGKLGISAFPMTSVYEYRELPTLRLLGTYTELPLRRRDAPESLEAHLPVSRGRRAELWSLPDAENRYVVYQFPAERRWGAAALGAGALAACWWGMACLVRWAWRRFRPRQA